MPGEVPSWILAMDDEREKQEMMEVMGLGKHFDKVNSPFTIKL